MTRGQCAVRAPLQPQNSCACHKPSYLLGGKASFFEVLSGFKHLAEEGWGLLNQEQGQHRVPAECRGALRKMDGEHPRQAECWGLRLLPPGSDG